MPTAVRAPGSLCSDARPNISTDRTRPSVAVGQQHHGIAHLDSPRPARAGHHRTDSRDAKRPGPPAAGRGRRSGEPTPAAPRCARGARTAPDRSAPTPRWAGRTATDDPASRSATSSSTSSSHSGSTRSALVTTGMPDRHTQVLQDGEMLGGLRHDALVGGDDQQREVDARRAGHHGAHEVLVPGHVHDARPPGRRRSSRGAKLRSMVIPRRRSSASRSIGAR